MSIQNKSQNDIRVGDQVRALTPGFSEELAKKLFDGAVHPNWFPKLGTVGTVVKIDTDVHDNSNVCVEWPDGSTTYAEGYDIWYCPATWLEKVENSQE